MLMQVRQRLVKVPVQLHYLNLICIPGLHVPTSNKLSIWLYILNDRAKLSAIMKPKRTQSSKREGMVLENETWRLKHQLKPRSNYLLGPPGFLSIAVFWDQIFNSFFYLITAQSLSTVLWVRTDQTILPSSLQSRYIITTMTKMFANKDQQW